MNVNIGGYCTLRDPDHSTVKNLFIEKIYYWSLCPESTLTKTYFLEEAKVIV